MRHMLTYIHSTAQHSHLNHTPDTPYLVCDLRAVNALLGVLGELHGEDVVVEEELKLLVGEVDAQLLQAVDIKVLKAKDVQEADLEVRGICTSETWRS